MINVDNIYYGCTSRCVITKFNQLSVLEDISRIISGVGIAKRIAKLVVEVTFATLIEFFIS